MLTWLRQLITLAGSGRTSVVARDAKFVIDYADAHQNVILASACSGHGFNTSPQ